MSFSYEDLVTAEDTTPTHAANCRALYEKSGGFYNVEFDKYPDQKDPGKQP